MIFQYKFTNLVNYSIVWLSKHADLIARLSFYCNNIIRWAINHTVIIRTALETAATTTEHAQKTIRPCSIAPTILPAITITTANFLQEQSQA